MCVLQNDGICSSFLILRHLLLKYEGQFHVSDIVWDQSAFDDCFTLFSHSGMRKMGRYNGIAVPSRRDVDT
jgi:hypothetical protein